MSNIIQNDIKELIKTYYISKLKYVLQDIQLFNKENIEKILYFFKNNTSFYEYDNQLNNILNSSINGLEGNILLKKINIFCNNNKYINPLLIFKTCSVEILKKTLKIFLYDNILNYYENMEDYINFFNQELCSKIVNYKKINSYDIDTTLNILDQLNKIKSDFYIIFTNLYLDILNKYSKDYVYIFPNNLVNSNDFFTSLIKLNNDKIIGGAKQIETDIKKFNPNHYIKNIYSRSDISYYKKIFDEYNINELIINNKIKLSKNFNQILDEISTISDLEDEKEIELLENYIKELFILSTDELKYKDILSICLVIDDFNLFLSFFVEQIIGQNTNLKNKLSIRGPKSLIAETLPLTSDASINNGTINKNQYRNFTNDLNKIFDKILANDYSNNTIDLKNDDVKLILMLETLDSIKHAYKTSGINKKHITVNFYKDIVKAKINNDEIKMN